MTVGGIVLAAGAGRRFGRPKALVELGGTPLVSLAVRTLRDGGCSPVLAVLGAGAVPDSVLSPARPVIAADWVTGMGASLRAGLEAAGDLDAVVVALVDQPFIGGAAVRRLLLAFEAGAVAAVAGYDGQPRNPVLLARAVWPEIIATCVGDAGARVWLRQHPSRVTLVPCDGTGSPFDIDTLDDLAEAERRLAAGRT